MVVIFLEQGANLHMAQLMPLPLTVSCFSKIQIGFTFLVLADPGSPRKRAVKWVCACVCKDAATELVKRLRLNCDNMVNSQLPNVSKVGDSEENDNQRTL